LRHGAGGLSRLRHAGLGRGHHGDLGAGAADVDFYLGTDGLGGDASSQTLYGDLMVGYGAADRLSVFLGTRLEANGSLGDASPGLRMGVFGTVVETGVFDLDLALEVGAGGRGLSEIHVAPGLELNLDLRSPLGPVGLYLRAQVPVQGTDGAPEFQLDLTRASTGPCATAISCSSSIAERWCPRAARTPGAGKAGPRRWATTSRSRAPSS
jgi:hypothetical protein